MSLRCQGLVVGLVALVLLAGCTEREAGNDATASPTTVPNSYSSQVDGVSIRWPEGWHRSENPLDARPISNNVELIALTTFVGAAAGQCSPDPDAAMASMENNDALFMLRASDGAGDPRPPRPDNLLTAPALAGTDGCIPAGVEWWRVPFQEHGRPYEVFVAAHSPLSAERRAEIEEFWDGLRLTPIDDGRADAELQRPYWHSLYTHCGVKETRFDGRDWVADPPISDGQGNPPRAWNNPDEHGTIELKDETTAVFTSRDGERSANFRPRTPQDPPFGGCQ